MGITLESSVKAGVPNPQEWAVAGRPAVGEQQ